MIVIFDKESPTRFQNRQSGAKLSFFTDHSPASDATVASRLAGAQSFKLTPPENPNTSTPACTTSQESSRFHPTTLGCMSTPMSRRTLENSILHRSEMSLFAHPTCMTAAL